MLTIEKTVTMSPEQWEIVIEGMRNPKNSWDRMDSEYGPIDDSGDSLCDFILGPNDHTLMTHLANGGPVHAKYRRMMPVWVTINAPLYWWKEFDTYKVGTVCNSCSTMHKIHVKEFDIWDFSTDHLFSPEDMIEFEERTNIDNDDALSAVNVDGNRCYFTPKGYTQMTCNILNRYREKFLEAQKKPMKDESKRAGLVKKYWWQMIQLLPTSYNQKRTILLNYEVLVNIYTWRKNHKLDEWHVFCDWIEKLPYSDLITGGLSDE